MLRLFNKRQFNTITRYVNSNILKQDSTEHGDNKNNNNNETDTRKEATSKSEEGSAESGILQKFQDLKTKHDLLDKKHAAISRAYSEAKLDLKLTKQRHEKELVKTKDFGAQNFAKDLFTVYDTLSNALKYKNESSKVEDSEGFDMLRKQIVKVFMTHDLHLIDPKEGDQFDHQVHEALYQMQHTELKEGQIGKVEQVGFKLKDRVLRAAQVGVVKGSENDGK